MTSNKYQIKRLSTFYLEAACQLINKASLPGWREYSLSDETVQKLSDRNSPEYLMSKTKDGFFYLAIDEVSSQVVGIIGLRKNEDVLANRISSFFVDPDCQNQGIGRQLYQKVEDKARQIGVKKLVVSSSPFAEKIYQHFGFKKVRVEWKDYEQAKRYYNVWMEKDL